MAPRIIDDHLSLDGRKPSAGGDNVVHLGDISRISQSTWVSERKKWIGDTEYENVSNATVITHDGRVLTTAVAEPGVIKRLIDHVEAGWNRLARESEAQEVAGEAAARDEASAAERGQAWLDWLRRLARLQELFRDDLVDEDEHARMLQELAVQRLGEDASNLWLSQEECREALGLVNQLVADGVMNDDPELRAGLVRGAVGV